MNFQVSVLVVLVTGIGLIGSNILINSVSALPAIKIGLPSVCDLYPDHCKIVVFTIPWWKHCPGPLCPVIDKFKDFPTPPDPGPIFQKLKPDESMIVMPIAGGNGTGVAIIVPTKDIQISNTTRNQ